MTVIVDWNLCESNGVCAQVAPEIFELAADDMLRIRVDEVDGELQPAAETAVRSCPKLAISLGSAPVG